MFSRSLSSASILMRMASWAGDPCRALEKPMAENDNTQDVTFNANANATKYRFSGDICQRSSDALINHH